MPISGLLRHSDLLLYGVHKRLPHHLHKYIYLQQPIAFSGFFLQVPLSGLLCKCRLAASSDILISCFTAFMNAFPTTYTNIYIYSNLLLSAASFCECRLAAIFCECRLAASSDILISYFTAFINAFPTTYTNIHIYSNLLLSAASFCDCRLAACSVSAANFRPSDLLLHGVYKRLPNHLRK